MAEPGSLKTLDDAFAWIYAHDGRIDALWEEQHRINRRFEDALAAIQLTITVELKEIRRDIQGMRKTIYTAVGGATMLGAVMGVAATIVTMTR